MKLKMLASAICVAGGAMPAMASELTYPIVDTYQSVCFDTQSNMQKCPATDAPMFGQDAQYIGIQPAYQKNADGTVTDKNTGLMWNASIDTNGDGQLGADDKLDFDQAQAFAKASRMGGYDDWRVPTIKELYSLILFDGEDPSGVNGAGSYDLMPFIDNRYFGFTSGDTKAGERLIDSQYLSSTKYVSTTMGGQETAFGVNFIDGRIKGYGTSRGGRDKKTFYVLFVRGDSGYGVNQYVDNNNGTISDQASGLTWQKGDSETGMDWPSALAYCEELTLAGSSSWRLPNVKELQSIVDYSRSPDTSDSASIDPVFDISVIKNEDGQDDYAFYWSSTTHQSVGRRGKNGGAGAYVAFGRSLGFMGLSWMDVHGAGSQRSDPKVHDGRDYVTGHGPQGDAIRFDNHVRCVSDNSTLAVQPESVIRDKVTFTLTGNEASLMDAKPGPRGGQGGSKAGGPPAGGAPGGGGPMGNIPQYAVDACNNLAAGNACSFEIYTGKVEGQCASRQQKMVCMPKQKQMPH